MGYYHRLATGHREAEGAPPAGALTAAWRCWTHRVRTVAKGVTITMVPGEPTLVLWRVQDLREALNATDDMGLRRPLASPRTVADKILRLLLPHLVDDESEA